MDKRIDFLGINPDIRLDQILIDANANRPAMFAMLKSFSVGTNPNFIISGCEVTVGGSSPTNTYALSAGYIYLNDEIVQVVAQSGSFDSLTEFLAFSKTVTYNSDGDITYVDGTPRQTWQENRGTITVASSVLDTELDAINGEHLSDKIKRYTAGGYEALSANATLQDDTKYVKFTLSSNVGQVIKLPNPTDKEVFNDILFMDIILNDGAVEVQQVDSTVVLAETKVSQLVVFVNDGSSWYVLTQIKKVGNFRDPVYNSGFTGGTPSLKYRLNASGNLELRGSMSATAGTGTAFQLPEPYRPSSTIKVKFSTSSAVAGDEYATIDSSGNVDSLAWSTGGPNEFNDIIIID